MKKQIIMFAFAGLFLASCSTRAQLSYTPVLEQREANSKPSIFTKYLDQRGGENIALIADHGMFGTIDKNGDPQSLGPTPVYPNRNPTEWIGEALDEELKRSGYQLVDSLEEAEIALTTIVQRVFVKNVDHADVTALLNISNPPIAEIGEINLWVTSSYKNGDAIFRESFEKEEETKAFIFFGLGHYGRTLEGCLQNLNKDIIETLENKMSEH